MSLLSNLVYWFTIKPRLFRLKKLLPDASIHPTGSRYVCDPPVMGTDIDFLVYTEKYIDDVLCVAGYVGTSFKNYSGEEGTDDFMAWRKGKENLIVTSSLKYAESFQTATYICKMYNIREKFQRVAIHESLRGNTLLPLIPQAAPILEKFSGPYKHAIHQAYRVKHGLKL